MSNPSCCSVWKIQLSHPLSLPPPLQPHPTVHASDIHLAFEKVQQLREWIKERDERFMHVSFPGHSYIVNDNQGWYDYVVGKTSVCFVFSNLYWLSNFFSVSTVSIASWYGILRERFRPHTLNIKMFRCFEAVWKVRTLSLNTNWKLKIGTKSFQWSVPHWSENELYPIHVVHKLPTVQLLTAQNKGLEYHWLISSPPAGSTWCWCQGTLLTWPWMLTTRLLRRRWHNTIETSSKLWRSLPQYPAGSTSYQETWVNFVTVILSLVVLEDVLVDCSLVPRPHPPTRKGVWWPLSNSLVLLSQQSWYWTTQWNSATSCNHVLNQPTYL